MYIKPILLYAWAQNITKTSWTKLEAFHSKTLRMVTGSNWFVSNPAIRMSLNMPSIDDTIKSQRTKIKQKIAHSNFEHINEIVNRKSHKERFKRGPLT